MHDKTDALMQVAREEDDQSNFREGLWACWTVFHSCSPHWPRHLLN